MVRANLNEPLVPTFGVLLNGQNVATDIGLWVTSVSVEDDLDVPGMFSLQLISREDEEGTSPWTDDERLAIGGTLQVSFGYGSDLEVLIVGEITALEPAFSIGNSPTLAVRGYDKRHRLNTVRRTRGFPVEKDSGIAEQICRDRGVPIEVVDSGVTHDYVLQLAQTDLDFLLERARRIHYELAMEGDTLKFRPVANDAAQAVTLSLSEDLLEFHPRLALVPVTGMTVTAWNEQDKEQPLTASIGADDKAAAMGGARSAAQHATDVLSEAIETIVHLPTASQAELDSMTAAHFDAAALDFVTGSGRCRGRTDVRAGSVVSIEGIGTRFSGEYYVTSAVHSYNRQAGYITDFQVRRNAS